VNAADIVIDAVRRVEFGPLTTCRNLSVLRLWGDDDGDTMASDPKPRDLVVLQEPDGAIAQADSQE
jgi:hypothetical protein